MRRSDRQSGRVGSDRPGTPEPSDFRGVKANDYSRNLRSGSRLSQRRLRGLTDELSDRDRRLLVVLQTVRVLSGTQAERLAFAEIGSEARGRIRRRVLARLVSLGLVETLERRVGGVRAGSAGLVYALSAAGQRLLDLDASNEPPRRRPAYTPGALFLAHALAVSEVYVSLTEATRSGDLRLAEFAVESAARFAVPGSELVLRPDALAVLEAGEVADVWWLEIDRSTESLPRLVNLLRRYLAFAEAGVSGPGGVVPRVLISVLDTERWRAVRGLIQRLPPPADELFSVCLDGDVAQSLTSELLDEIREPP